MSTNPPFVIDIAEYGQNSNPSNTPPLSTELVSTFGYLGEEKGIPPTTKNAIHYAVEIDTGIVTATNHDFGLDMGKFRFITDRPKYDGSTVIPVYGSDEIDINGYSVSGDNITDVYYEDFILKNGFSGNPSRSVDISNCCGYGNSSSFSFQIRADKIGGSGFTFWRYCEENNIYLTNAIVRVWVVINDVFNQVWRGRLSATPYTDSYFEFTCADESNTIHKMIPPKQEVIQSNTQTNVSQVSIFDSTGKLQAIVPQNIVTQLPNVNLSTVTVPVVLGDVCYSPIKKMTDVETYFDTGINKITYCVQNTYHRITASDGITDNATLQLLCNGVTITNGQLVGSYLQVISGQNANTETIYRVIANTASVAGTGNLANRTVFTITIQSLLVDSSKKLVAEDAFNSNYTYYMGTSPYSASPPYVNSNTWIFKISSFSIPTSLSNLSVNAIMTSEYNYIDLWSYNSNTLAYDNISAMVDISSGGGLLKLKSNTATSTGQVSIIEDIGLAPIEYGLRRILPASTDYLNNYTSNIIGKTTNQSNLSLVTNKVRNQTGYKSFQSDVFVTQDSPVSFYIYAKYNMAQLLNKYDDIYYLVDYNIFLGISLPSVLMLSKSIQYMMVDYLQEANSPILKNNGISTPTNINIQTYTAPYNFNLIPNEFYPAIPSADNISVFYNRMPVSVDSHVDRNNTLSYNQAQEMAANTGTADKNDLDLCLSNQYITFFHQIIMGYGQDGSIKPSFGIKQITLMGSRKVETIKGDLYTTLQGELTGNTATQANTQTNSVYDAFIHILEDYDGIYPTLIDYGDLSDSRDTWHIGRTLTDQQNSINYLTDLATQSFVEIFTNRKGQLALRSFDGTGVATATHDQTVIVDNSISSFDKTDITSTYNSFNCKYNYKAGINDYTKSFYISGLDGTLPGGAVFPDQGTQENGNPLWFQFVSGLTDSIDNYNAAKVVWNNCFSAYQKNKVIQQAQNELQELSYFIDRADFLSLAPNAGTFNAFAGGGSGTDSSAWKSLYIMSTWSTKQKYIAQYSIPINNTTVLTDMMDCIYFVDDIYTNGLARLAWVTGIEVDAGNDQLKITAILQPISGQ